MSKVFAVNIKNPKLRYQVVSYDKNTKLGVLRGQYGGEFTKSLSKESLARDGYALIKEEDDAVKPSVRSRSKARVQDAEGAG